MIIALEVVNIDMTGNIKIPGINIIRFVDQFGRVIFRVIGKEVCKFLANAVGQCTQSAVRIRCFSGRPQHIDECFGSDMISFVGEQVGDQKKIRKATLFCGGEREKVVRNAEFTEHLDLQCFRRVILGGR